MKKRVRIVASFLLLLLATGAYAQVDLLSGVNPNSVLTSTLIGVGSATLQDSYLSPLYYRGTGVQVLHERAYSLPRWGRGYSFQQYLKFNLASTKNPTQNNSTLGGMLTYQGGVLYRLPVESPLRLYAGAQAEATVGFIYNQRNGNNPATAKVMSNLRLTAMATYQFMIKEYPLLMRAQLSTPFAGVYFAPKFGQSYYEIFGLGNKHGIVRFGSFHNHQALNGLFTVDLPVRRATIRVGYLYDGMRTEANYISTHCSSHSFLLGYAKAFQVTEPKKRSRQLGQIYY